MTRPLRTSPVRRGLLALGACAAVSLTLPLPVAQAAAPSSPSRATAATAVASGLRLTPYEARLLTLTNRTRAARGLRPLTAQPGTSDVARRWALQLAAQGQLAHNPGLVGQLSGAGSAGWRSLSENVGVGSLRNADDVFAAYLRSPGHRANLLSRGARYVGIGSVQVRGGMAWNVMDFTDSYTRSYGVSRVAPVGYVNAADVGTMAARTRLAG